MKILVTGGAGYIGSHLVHQLLTEKRDVQVTVLDKYLYERGTLDEFKDNKRLKLIEGDICNIIDMVKAIKGVDVVIALAAIVGDPACALNEDQTHTTNYHATHLLVELCNYYGVKRLIFASSCSVYGASTLTSNEGSKVYPLSLYAKTRVMSEEVIRRHAGPDLHWTILRFATVFGWSRRMRFDLVINFLTAKAFNTKEIDIIGGEQWRPLIHVADVARATKLAALANKKIVSREIFNVGSNKFNYKIKELGKFVKKHVKDVKINAKDIAASDRRDYKVSFDKIHSLLKFRPHVTLEKGIQEIVQNLQKQEINYLDEKYYNVKYLFKQFTSRD